MELFRAPTKCWVVPINDIKTPIASPDIQEDKAIWFDYIDGIYSNCINKDGELVHLVAWAEVYVDETMIDVPRPVRKE